MAYDPDNIFAKILRGEIPAQVVYEDTHTYAFMDIMPQVDGHTLVIPKSAATDLTDVSLEALAHTMTSVQKIAVAVKQAFAAPGIMIAQLNGSAAGQTVFHLHFHVIPRYSGADMGMHAREMASPQDLAANADKIRAVLNS